MQSLTVASLALEPLLPSHAEEMFVLLRDPALYRYLDHPPPPSVEHLHSVYTRLVVRRSPDGSEHWLNWAVRAQGTGLVGHVQATVEASGSAWIAYVVGQQFQRRGYATAATSRMIKHLVTAYGARRFLATVERANLASIALLGRLGMRPSTPEEADAHGVSASEYLFVAEAEIAA